jgi:hypothetical protein
MSSELYQLKEHLFKLLEDSNLGPRYIINTSDEDGECYSFFFLGGYKADINLFIDMIVPSIKNGYTTQCVPIPIKNKETINEIMEKMVEFIKGADKI